MKMRLINDQVLVRLDAQKTDSDGKHGAAIVLADAAQWYPTEGTVVAAGPGLVTKRGFLACSLRKGQRVALTFRPGQDLTIDGAQYTITHEFADERAQPFEGILAVLEEAA